MFDIGFGELLVIGIIALLVVGPGKLPELARTAGRWAGAARRVLGEIKAEVKAEALHDEFEQHNRDILEQEKRAPNTRPEKPPQP